MKRPIALACCALLLLGLIVGNTSTDSAAPPAQDDRGELPSLGPIERIAHFYGTNVEANVNFCFAGATLAFIHVDDLNGPAGVLINTTSVSVQWSDFGGGGIGVETITLDPFSIEIQAINGCFNAAPGAVLATVSGSFANGIDTFSVDVIRPIV